MAYRHKGTFVLEGINRELAKFAIEKGTTAPEPKSDSHNLDGEAFKVVADNMVPETGERKILCSRVSSANPLDKP